MDRQELLAQKKITLSGFANVMSRFLCLDDATINLDGIVIRFAQHATDDTEFPVCRIPAAHMIFKRFPRACHELSGN